jgi:hypothetical protein
MLSVVFDGSGIKNSRIQGMHSLYADLSTASALMLMSVSLDNGEVVALNKFSTTIKSIPSASPHLHTLKLNFECFGGGVFKMLKEQSGPNSIFAVINKLRFPCLRTVSIDIKLVEINAPVDFRPFLIGHPSLHDVSINLQGQPLPDIALPNLRSFEGSPIDCVTICNGTRRIESLKLLLLEPKFDLSLRGARKQSGVGSWGIGSWGIGSWGDEYLWDEDTVLQRLAKTPTLRHLHLTTGILHPDESPQFEEQGLHNDYITKIANSCPHLTHLELHVWGSIVSVYFIIRQL